MNLSESAGLQQPVRVFRVHFHQQGSRVRIDGARGGRHDRREDLVGVLRQVELGLHADVNGVRHPLRNLHVDAHLVDVRDR